MVHFIKVYIIKYGGFMARIKTDLFKIDGLQNVSLNKVTESIDGTGEKKLVQALSKMAYSEKGNNDLLKNAKLDVSCAIGKLN